TEEFCGDRKVTRPSCSKTGGLARVVGYYEGWTLKRPCNEFMPEQIPSGVYTHLNFAFATIHPQTFEVLPANPTDVPLYKRLTALKRRDKDLKVFIAIGGWTFSDPGSTATTFSDLAGSEQNQKAFFKSLISFMST
ncbi:glycoside hydrolase, partial [Aureobasidium namibiae CBS 147.97]